MWHVVDIDWKNGLKGRTEKVFNWREAHKPGRCAKKSVRQSSAVEESFMLSESMSLMRSPKQHPSHSSISSMEIKGSDISGLYPHSLGYHHFLSSWILSPCQEVMQMAMMMIRGPNLQSSHELKTKIPAGILWQNPQQNLLNNTLHVSLQRYHFFLF